MARWGDTKRRLDSPWAVVLLTAVLYGSFLVWSLGSHGFDLTRPIVAGDKFITASGLPSPLYMEQRSWGYDGQFYYRLALDPLTETRTAYGITLDLPALRQQRLLYPLTVWAVSLGKPAAVPAAMLLVNLTALLTAAWVASKLAQSFGRHALWGTVVVLYPGLLLSLARDLTEVMAVTLSLASIYLYRRHRYVGVAVAAGLATFTRETSLILLGSFLVISLFYRVAKRQRDHSSLLIGTAVAAAAYLGWQWHLGRVWGTLPLLVDQRFNVTSLPLLGLAKGIAEAPGWLYLAEVAFVLLLIAVAARCLCRSKIEAPVKLAWVGYLILFCFLSKNVWSEDWSFLRSTADFAALSAVVLLGYPGTKRYALYALLLSAILWLRLALRLT